MTSRSRLARPAPRRGTLAAVAAGLAAGLAACGAGAGNARLAHTEASGDGVLRVGLLLDNSGSQVYLNDAQRAAVELAVQQANLAGGHKGRPIELIPPAPSTDTAEAARQLVAAKADVVIGPTDSSHAAGAIDVLDKAKTVLISPANFDDELSNYPSGGYYFRTSPTESSEGAALAAVAKSGNAKRVAVLRQKGSYGQVVGGVASSSATASGMAEAGSGEFTGHDARAAASAALAAGADAVIVVARDDPQAVLAQVHDAGVPGSKLVLSDGLIAKYASGLASGALDGARGLVPGLYPSAAFQTDMLKQAPSLIDMTFAPEAYDAAALAILAAGAAQDDGGPSIASHLIAVSGGTPGVTDPGKRQKCTVLADCLALESKGTPIDYDGQSGPIAFDQDGGVTTANFTVFRYSADNTARQAGTQAVAR